MFESLKSFVYKEVFSDLEIDQGNKILLYINCCLSGREYPSGSLLKEHLLPVVPISVYKMLVQLRPHSIIAIEQKNGFIDQEQLKQLNIDINSTFPYLRLLLKFDSAQFLNVISTCIDASVFTSPEQLNSVKKNGNRSLIIKLKILVVFKILFLFVYFKF